MSKRIFLIGGMGAGKTAIGRELARLLQRPFFDTDEEIERCTGVDIAYIFEKEGESGFRQRETRALEKLCHEPTAVIATGGGIVVKERNRELIRAAGTVMYLEVSLESQMTRARKSSGRPLLDTDDPLARLKTLAEERGPLYRELATHVIPTDGRKVQQVAKDIYDLVIRHAQD